LLEDKILTYKEQIHKRKQLLKQSIEDYEELISRTGLQSLIDVREKQQLIVSHVECLDVDL